MSDSAVQMSESHHPDEDFEVSGNILQEIAGSNLSDDEYWDDYDEIIRDTRAHASSSTLEASCSHTDEMQHDDRGGGANRHEKEAINVPGDARREGGVRKEDHHRIILKFGTRGCPWRGHADISHFLYPFGRVIDVFLPKGTSVMCFRPLSSLFSASLQRSIE